MDTFGSLEKWKIEKWKNEKNGTLEQMENGKMKKSEFWKK